MSIENLNSSQNRRLLIAEDCTDAQVFKIDIELQKRLFEMVSRALVPITNVEHVITHGQDT